MACTKTYIHGFTILSLSFCFLFIQTVAGTTQSARTTVPFIYNMDDSVEGLSVIDFPGVDDRDESIKGLAQLLVGLAQVVIFVCGYE